MFLFESYVSELQLAFVSARVSPQPSSIERVFRTYVRRWCILRAGGPAKKVLASHWYPRSLERVCERTGAGCAAEKRCIGLRSVCE